MKDKSWEPTTGVVLHLTPPAMQAALQHPQLLLSDVAWGGVHGEVGGQPGLGEGLMNRTPLLLSCCRGSRSRARVVLGREGVWLSGAAGRNNAESAEGK